MVSAKRFIGVAATLAVMSLGPVGLPSAEVVAAGRERIAMMDDMKMKPDSSGPANNNMGNMGQPGGASAAPADDKMKMQAPGPMQGQQQDSGMMQMMQMMERMHNRMLPSGSGMGPSVSASGPVDVTERLEGRIAFLKAELQINDKQLADWNLLADALRSSRQHLLEARKQLVMDDKVTGPNRIGRYEQHLNERLEAIKSARTAFSRLYGSLSDGQKQTADSILLPLIATF
jgi:LTXXQ motif family protein